MNNDFQRHALEKLADADEPLPHRRSVRDPVHVVYGGAHLFKAETFKRLGPLALQSIESYAPNFVEFAQALWLEGADSLPTDAGLIRDLEFRFADNPDKSKRDSPEAWFAWMIFQKTIEKLESEAVEDYRIDFEDGYGIRSDEEEDSHCLSASSALADFYRAFESERANTRPMPGTGFRIKSFQRETRDRAVRTFGIFASNLVEKSEGRIPQGFTVTLPKITSPKEPGILSQMISEFEKQAGLPSRTIDIEVLIETPQSIPLIREIALACDGRCVSAHFGAYDYTARLGISAPHQHLKHAACNFARNMMQVSLTPLGIRLADSVTTELPIPLHKKENLSIKEIAENRKTVRDAWRKHFNDVTHSQINGFYQSWDLHPAQLASRFAAVYAFYLGSFDEQAIRLRGFVEKATQAMTTGNLFDDLASAEGILNFFRRGTACLAFQIDESIGLSEEELATGSFAKIMEKRFSKSAP